MVFQQTLPFKIRDIWWRSAENIHRPYQQDQSIRNKKLDQLTVFGKTSDKFSQNSQLRKLATNLTKPSLVVVRVVFRIFLLRVRSLRSDKLIHLHMQADDNEFHQLD